MSANRSNIYWHLENQLLGQDQRAIGMVYEKLVTITAAELKLLATTPKELVEAPGANKLIELVSATLFLDYGSETLAEPSDPDDLAFEYDDGSGSQIITWGSTALIVTVVDMMEVVIPVSLGGVATSGNMNKNVVLINTGTDYTGNASDDTVLKVAVQYRIHDFGNENPRFS